MSSIYTYKRDVIIVRTYATYTGFTGLSPVLMDYAPSGLEVE